MREAIVTMSDEALEEMGLGDLVAFTRDAGIRELEELDCHGNGGVMQLEVDEKLDGERLSAFKAVSQWEFVTEKEDTYLYLIEIVAPDLTDEITDYGDELVGTFDPSMTKHGATMELVGPQQTISKALQEYEAAGISPELEKLGDYDGTETDLDALTERQREIVHTAYEMGFYEVPREVSTDEVAAELDLDASTVAEHLQRAERNLLSQKFGAQG
jgi:DNA-binding CsgD family transcriptional regulator